MVRSGVRKQSPQPERHAFLPRRIYRGHYARHLSPRDACTHLQRDARKRVVLAPLVYALDR